VTYDFFSNATVAEANLDDWDVLPTANLVYALDERSNLRLAAARTLSRPDLRELTPAARSTSSAATRTSAAGPQSGRRSGTTTCATRPIRARTGCWPSAVSTRRLRSRSKQIVTGGSDRLLQPQNSDKGRNFGVEVEAAPHSAASTRD
jgi:outer membrane receptor protein involved in Fe transport